MAKKPIQTVFTPLWRGMLVLVWLVSLPGSPKLGFRGEALEITLSVDTQIDSNEPGYQECAAAADDCSLRGAITRANLDAGNDYSIQVPAGVYNLTLEGVLEDGNATGDLDISGNVTFVGDDADNTTIDANQVDRVLHVRLGARVELRNITLRGGQGANGIVAGGAGEYGGGIFNQGDLLIRDCVVRDNQAGDGAPGALEIDGGDGGSGGGIYNLGVTTIVGSTIMNNLAGNGGNGWQECSSHCMMWICQNCTYPGGGGNGGGILNKGVLYLEASVILSNTIGQPASPIQCFHEWYGECSYYYEWMYGMGGVGGGIYNQGRVELEDSRIEENEGGAGAGGIENYGVAFLTVSTISGNRGDAGGGISNQLEAVLARCTVEGNSSGNGGGIYNSSDILVKETWIRDNDAALGGGIYNDGTATVVDSQIAYNYTREGDAAGYWVTKGMCDITPAGISPGGGVYNAGDMIIDYSQISSNVTGDGGSGASASDCYGSPDGGAGGHGGGIFNSGNLELNLCTVEGNSTGNGGQGGEVGSNDGPGGAGGGIYNSGTLSINLSTFDGNQTGEGLSGGPGGAIANEGQLTITGGSVRGNLTIQDGDGGGIYASTPITISALSVISNTAAGSGGGFYFEGTTGEVANSILGYNQSGILGSGLYASGSCVNLENSTFAQNYGGDGSGLHAISSTLSLTNTILVSHTIGVVVDENSLLDMESTLWGGGIWANQLDWTGGGTIITGTQNYWDSPGFVDPAGQDYHILATSPAIDRGVNNVSDMDVDFQPRPNPASLLIDLGADEFWTATPIETVSVSGQPTVTRLVPITLTATISPTSATPNILYYWRPPPEAGQWTESAVYVWRRSGTETVALMAINAASVVSDTITITVEQVYSQVYLPVIDR